MCLPVPGLSKPLPHILCIMLKHKMSLQVHARETGKAPGGDMCKKLLAGFTTRYRTRGNSDITLWGFVINNKYLNIRDSSSKG